MSSSNSSGFTSGQGTSQGSSSGQSSSNSYIPQQEPQMQFLDQFGNMAGQLGSQQYGWAQDQFANNSDLTEQNINGYLENTDMSSQAAQRDFANYNDIFNPAMNSLTDEYQAFQNPENVQRLQGAYESTAAQSDDAQRKNAEKELQSYGVNPSDPRYASTVQASRTAEAAHTAAAGTAASQYAQQYGDQLRGQALQEANMLPGQMATEQNVGMQGITGSENAALSNTSAGALTLGTTPGYLNTGVANNKFQPLGTSSSSTNSSTNSSQNTSQGANSSNSVGAAGGGSSSPKSNQPQQQPQQGQQGTANSNGGKGNQGNPASGSSGAQSSYPPPNAGVINTDPNGGGSNPTYGQPPDGVGPQDPGTGDVGQGGYTPPAVTDPGNEADWGGWSAPDAGGGGDSGGFAQGGAIPDDQDDDGGGLVPQSMSPSGGQDTDDVPAMIPETGGQARLNADEFVIPKDVVQWMGHKFFQDLIMKSRKARMGAPAHPTMQGGVEHHNMGGMTGNNGVDPNIGNSQGFGFGRVSAYDQTPKGFAGGAPDVGGKSFGAPQQPAWGGMMISGPRPGYPSAPAPTPAPAPPPVSQAADVPLRSQPDAGIPDAGSAGSPGDVPLRSQPDATMRRGGPPGPGGGGWQSYGATDPSRAPTMRNYKSGTAQSTFQPRGRYFQPRAPFQGMPDASWTNVPRNPTSSAGSSGGSGAAPAAPAPQTASPPPPPPQQPGAAAQGIPVGIQSGTPGKIANGPVTFGAGLPGLAGAGHMTDNRPMTAYRPDGNVYATGHRAGA